MSERRICAALECEEWFTPSPGPNHSRQLHCSRKCRKRDNYLRRVEDGRCTRCPEAVKPGEILCPVCRAALAVVSGKRRSGRKAARKCVECEQPAAKGVTRCLFHKLANARHQRKRRAHNGV